MGERYESADGKIVCKPFEEAETLSDDVISDLANQWRAQALLSARLSVDFVRGSDGRKDTAAHQIDTAVALYQLKMDRTRLRRIEAAARALSDGITRVYRLDEEDQAALMALRAALGEKR